MRTLSVLLLLCAAVFGADIAEVNAHVSDELDFGRKGVRNFVFSNASRRLFVSHYEEKPNDLLYQWDLDKKEIEHTYHLGEGYFCFSVAIFPNGRLAIVECMDSKNHNTKTLLIDTTTFATVRELGVEGRSPGVRFDRQGERFLLDVRKANFKWEWVAFDAKGQRLESFAEEEFEPEEKPPGKVWSIRSTKDNYENRGLYLKDENGKPQRVTTNEWHYNYSLTTDGKYLASTTWDGEFMVWRLADAKEVARVKLAKQYGYLQYDENKNRFLWGDATRDGTTKLKSIVLKTTAE